MIYDPLISGHFNKKVIIANSKFKTNKVVLYRGEMQKILDV